MIIKKWDIKMIVLLIVLMFIPLVLSSCFGSKEKPLEKVKVEVGNIKAEITSTGVVEPRNRLEIKPPVSGRIEQVLVVEGQRIAKGKILAWLSSSDRAALLDAARAKGEEEVSKWEDIYKPTPIVAPLSGFIIKRAIEPGQSVTISDAILVMADKLIVKAQVDETDIGNISLGQRVNIVLDAYQGETIPGKVEHIAYESDLINNVNIYYVDVLPTTVPSYFRSGMSASVSFTLRQKNGALLLPMNAYKKVQGQTYVFVIDPKTGQPKAIQIETGLENTSHIEVVSGLKEGDEVVIPTAKMTASLTERRHGPINPFSKQNNK